MARKKKSIHVLMVIDDVNYRPAEDSPFAGKKTRAQEEVELYQSTLTRLLPDHELTYTITEDFDARASCDLLIFDYGGMMQAYSSPFYAYCKAASKFTVDNPNTLVVIASRFTLNFGMSQEFTSMGLFDEYLQRPGVFGLPNYDTLQMNKLFGRVIPNLLWSPLALSEDDVRDAIKAWFK